MRFLEPLIATVVSNPTNQDLKYTWLSKTGMFVKAKSSVTLPYCVYTDATPSQRAQLGEAIRAKYVQLAYQVRGLPVEQVTNISTSAVYGKAKRRRKVKLAPVVKPVEPPPKPVEPVEPVEPEVPRVSKKVRREQREARRVRRASRTEIINAVGEGKDALEDGKDLVQKATGQETVSMQKALGWKEPPTEDTRGPQEAEAVTMNAAVTEGVGDPFEKAAEAAAKEKKATEQKKKLDATKAPIKPPAKPAAPAKPAETAQPLTAAAKQKLKRSAAGKKAAATRAANKVENAKKK